MVAAAEDALRGRISTLANTIATIEKMAVEVLLEEPECELHPVRVFLIPTVDESKLRNQFKRLLYKLSEVAATIRSQMVVKKKGTQQSSSRGRGQGIRTWVPAIFESDLSSKLPIKFNLLSMPETRGLFVARTSSSAAVRREQLHAMSVASHLRVSARSVQQPTFA